MGFFDSVQRTLEGRGRADPAGLRDKPSKSPKSPEKTAEQAALERRQRSMLDEEIEDTEERLKSLARGRIGTRSLLTGAATTASQAAGTRGSSSAVSTRGKPPGGLMPRTPGRSTARK